MSQSQWEKDILNSVVRAATGNRTQLVALSVALEQAALARECLSAAGYGDGEDASLLAMVAEVLEMPDIPA